VPSIAPNRTRKEDVRKMHTSNDQQFGDYYVNFSSIPAGMVRPELFKGLPEDACQCEHWGYLFKGRARFTYTDGSEEVISAGEAFYAPPGHVVEILEDSEFVQFSTPKEAFEQLQEVTERNLEAMGES
jgi:hypothetical protein